MYVTFFNFLKLLLENFALYTYEYMACICDSQCNSVGQHCHRAIITGAVVFILQVRTDGHREVNK